MNLHPFPKVLESLFGFFFFFLPFATITLGILVIAHRSSVYAILQYCVTHLYINICYLFYPENEYRYNVKLYVCSYYY